MELNLNIKNIIKKLELGEVVALPTDTVFGLFCKANNEEGIQKIYKMKNRSLEKNLCLYTLDLPFSLSVNYPIIGMTYIYEQIGYRSANISPYIFQIVEKVGNLVGTSCNLSGEFPITHFKHVKFNVPILEERCIYGLESTIFSLDNQHILRNGLIKFENYSISNLSSLYFLKKNKNLQEKYKFPYLNCKDLASNFWFLINEYKSTDFNINCRCHTCSLILSYLT